MARLSVREERRADILAAFEVCVLRQGLARTTLADVAAQADQPRSLVRYFLGNRDDMVAHLIERLLARGRAAMATAPVGADSATPEHLSRVLIEHVFSDPTTNAILYELWYLALRDAALRTQVAQMFAQLTAAIAARTPAPAHGPQVAHDAAYTAVAAALGHSLFHTLGLAPSSTAGLVACMGRALQCR